MPGHARTQQSHIYGMVTPAVRERAGVLPTWTGMCCPSAVPTWQRRQVGGGTRPTNAPASDPLGDI